MRSSARDARSGAAVLLAIFGVFQACLAGGAPWGRAAYGGTHPGRLPVTHRRVSAVAAPVYWAAAAFTASSVGSPPARRRVLTGLTAWLVVGVAANAASRSRWERLIWTPLCAITAACTWRARDR